MADRRLLIVVGQTAPNLEELPFGVRTLIEAADTIMVVSPRLPSRLDWLSSATDKAEQTADDRLAVVLGQLEEAGAEPSGEVGADDPVLAFEDAIAAFRPDHLLIGMRSADRAGWQERGLLEAVRARVDMPITVFDTPD